jgi:para-aminobenzoate synthetase component 1
VGTLNITADHLVSGLLYLAENETVCLLDSSGVSYLGSHFLVAGIEPIKTIALKSDDPIVSLTVLDNLRSSGFAAIFTISYEFGRKLQGFQPNPIGTDPEPDIFISLFDSLIIHDYTTSSTRIVGNPATFRCIKQKLLGTKHLSTVLPQQECLVRSDFTKSEYLGAVDDVQERIRSGDTYQTNLSQQLTAKLPNRETAANIFKKLRDAHPAAFSAFIRRNDSTVISASPERFFRMHNGLITTSPIKGTRPRGETPEEDEHLKKELLTSQKDLAENTMIVDLLRNDLGRVCHYGSVKVEKLCELEEHPSLFHLVSTVSGRLAPSASVSDILKALFPCGSITGAPKISTMKIIDEIERSPRGLSMGAIGYYIPPGDFGFPETLDTSVAIRTMVIRERSASFNVGGGIVIDSDPEKEYEECLTKASALLAAINGRLEM